MTTGLGSVNVANLVSNWNTVKFSPTTTTLTLNGGTTAITITHGQSVAVAATVTPSSGTGTPTGDVVLMATTPQPSGGTLDLFHLSGGQASGSSSDLPGGGVTPDNVSVRYGGDGTYASSVSNTVSVTVNPEQSRTTLSLQGTDLSGHPLANPFPFGSLIFVRADVAGQSGYGIPTGPVTFTDSFGSLPSVNPQVSPPVQVLSNPPLNSQGNTSIGDGIISFDAGNHSISASYGGDLSFSTSSSTTPVTFTIQPGFVVASAPTDVSLSGPGMSGTMNVSIIASTGFTAITFACTGLPSEATCSSSFVTGKGPTTVVSTQITVTTMGPHTTMLHSNGQRYYYALLFSGGLPLACILFVAVPRSRRMGIFVVLVLIALLLPVPGCGGGGGGQSQQLDPGTPAGTYTVTLTASGGGLSQSSTFSLQIQ